MPEVGVSVNWGVCLGVLITRADYLRFLLGPLIFEELPHANMLGPEVNAQGAELSCTELANEGPSFLHTHLYLGSLANASTQDL